MKNSCSKKNILDEWMKNYVIKIFLFEYKVLLIQRKYILISYKYILLNRICFDWMEIYFDII